MSTEANKEMIAVIGSGISGLSAAWLLQRGGFGVTLYESETYFGGHTLTDETVYGCPVDLGFQVFNRTTYGHFEQFLETLGVDSEESDMSFAFSVDGGALEWGSHSLSTIFAQGRNLCRPSFWKMLFDVIRFGKEAPKVLEDDTYKTVNVAQYLNRHSYSKSFTEQYFLPMCAAIWSVSHKQCLEFPIQVLVRFWVNHHFFDIFVRPKWRVVKNRSRSYVAKVIEQLKDARCNTAVVSVKRTDDRVIVLDAHGEIKKYHQVVFATHPDVALKILGEDAEKEEIEMLEGVPYAENVIFLHRDAAFMPKDRCVWSAWNVLQASGSKGSSADERPVCVSYFINALQRLPPNSGDIFVTLNPPIEPAPAKTIRKLKLSHPVFSFASLTTQEKLRTTNGRRRTWFCGAWCGYGFHEDGIKAAVAVVEKLRVTLPWTPRPTSPYTTWGEAASVATVDRLLRAAVTMGSIRFIMPNGSERTYGGATTSEATRRVCHSRVRVFDLRMFSRIIKDTDIGLGESYMAGEFEPDDLTSFISVLTQNLTALNASQGLLGLLNWVGTKAQSMAHSARANTVEGSRRNIAEHYDLGNDLYRLFLDETWMYSCAYFKTPQDSLSQAQLNKLDLIIDKLELRPSDRVLEIGCGWGGFAVRAAKRSGCELTGVTISEEQFTYATERVIREGLEQRVSIKMCDYREMESMAGSFDKVVSIEMIEAVGHENLGEYFAIIERMLKPGGKAVIQAITYKDEFYASYCRGSDFIRRHIFPGCHLPSMKAMLEATQRAGLVCYHVEDIGLHYATTLRRWHERWVGEEAAIKALGHDSSFFRKWRFYFSYCEAGFAQQFIHDFQIVWIKPHIALTRWSGGIGDGPQGVRENAYLWLYLLSSLVASKFLAALSMVPVFALTFFALAALCRAVAPSLGFVRLLDGVGTAMWTRSLVSAVFSACAAVLWITCWAVGSFADRSSSSSLDTYCQVLLSLWSGYCGWALIDMLSGPWAVQGSEVLYSALGLACTSVCLAQECMCAYLCLLLVAEAHSLIAHAEALAVLAGLCLPLLRHVHWAALVSFRIGGHAALALLVASEPHLFPHPASWVAALAALAVVNVVNFNCAVDLYFAGPPALRHAPRRV